MAEKDTQEMTSNEEVEVLENDATEPTEASGEEVEGNSETESVHSGDTEVEDKLKSLEEKVSQLESDKEALNNKVLRVQADYENFKRRVREEKARDRQYRAQALVEDLLPVADNFSRALQSEVETDEAKGLKQGVEMVYRQFIEALVKEGVEEIEGLNEPFDPNQQQAVMQDESPDHEPNTVTQVLQKGYKLNGRVLRPAMVKVNS